MANQTAAQGYGGFWIRFVASLVDFLIIGVGLSLISLLLWLIGLELLGQQLIFLVLTYLYFAFMQSSTRQATYGKALVGLKVTGYDGGRISFLRSLARTLATILSVLTLMIGFIIAAFTSRKQALHDFIASTYVVRESPGHVVAALGVALVALVAPFVVVFVVGATMVAGMMGLMGGGMMDQAMKDAQKPTAQSVVPVQIAPVQKPAPLPTVAKAPSSPASAASEPPKPAIVEPPKPAVVEPPKPVPVEIPKQAPVRVAEVKPAPAPSPAPDEKPASTPAPVAAPPPIPQARAGTPGPKYNDLMTAVVYRDAAAVSELIAFGRWLDKPDSQGVTPLMVATMLGDTTNAEALLKAGANPDRAVRIARERRDSAMTALLERYATSKRP